MRLPTPHRFRGASAPVRYAAVSGSSSARTDEHSLQHLTTTEGRKREGKMLNPEDLVLAEAERDVRELEQYLADQRIRVLDLHASGRVDDEMKAREGLLLLADALVIARRRWRAEREAAAMGRPDPSAVACVSSARPCPRMS